MSKQATGHKLVLIGDSGVGKTCLISRFISGQFDANVTSTNGASYASKKVEFPELGKSLVLDIWDTAGQEKFRSMGRHFYQNSNIIVIVFDITRKETFDNIKNFWYNDIKEKAEKYKVIGIVGNKYDLFDKEGEDIIEDNIVKEFVDQIKNDKDSKVVNMNVSALQGYNIKLLFSELVKQYLENEFNILIQNNKSERGNSVKLGKQKKKKKKCCG